VNDGMAKKRNRDEYLSGKCRYFRYRQPDKFGKWGLDLYPDAPSLEKIRKLMEEGIKNHLKKDDDGYYMHFGRPTEIKLRTGQTKGVPPITVLDGSKTGSDGRPMPLHHDIMVGNGSDVIVKLNIYGGDAPSGFGTYTACRVESVLVTNLIPYSGVREFDADQAKSVDGLLDQVEPLF
jgi:hypothetical protein